jgi:hypothetical protein
VPGPVPGGFDTPLADQSVGLCSAQAGGLAGLRWRKRQESNLPGTPSRPPTVLKTARPTGDDTLPSSINRGRYAEQDTNVKRTDCRLGPNLGSIQSYDLNPARASDTRPEFRTPRAIAISVSFISGCSAAKARTFSRETRTLFRSDRRTAGLSEVGGGWRHRHRHNGDCLVLSEELFENCNASSALLCP